MLYDFPSFAKRQKTLMSESALCCQNKTSFLSVCCQQAILQGFIFNLGHFSGIPNHTKSPILCQFYFELELDIKLDLELELEAKKKFHGAAQLCTSTTQLHARVCPLSTDTNKSRVVPSHL